MSAIQRSATASTRRRAGTTVALLAALSFILGGPAAAHEDDPVTASACVEVACGDRCQETVSAARRATAAYQRENRALADGFLPTPTCVAVPGVGGMGVHYIRPDRMADVEVDPRQPEILVYGLNADGGRFLVALEYFAPVLSNGQPWRGGPGEPPPVVDNAPPVLFGRTFDGPMPGQGPGQPWNYSLHLWAWKHNPSGLFAPFNPRLTCP
jgi:hypothetical protein